MLGKRSLFLWIAGDGSGMRGWRMGEQGEQGGWGFGIWGLEFVLENGGCEE